MSVFFKLLIFRVICTLTILLRGKYIDDRRCLQAQKTPPLTITPVFVHDNAATAFFSTVAIGILGKYSWCKIETKSFFQNQNQGFLLDDFLKSGKGPWGQG